MNYRSETLTAALFLLLGAAAPAPAQDHAKGGKSEGHEARQSKPAQEHGKPAQQEKGQSRDQGKSSHDHETAPVAREKPHGEQGRPAHDQLKPRRTPEQQPAAPTRQTGRRIDPPHNPPQPQPPHHPDRPRQQSHDWQQHRGWENNGSWHGHSHWKEHRSERWEHDHRNWAQRGGYGGYYIPQPTYVMYFGPTHFFRFQRAPVIYMGYPRFYYRNTSFIMVDPYPASWDDNWYDNDDVYIDYDEGYYMHNRRDPGISISIAIIN